MKCASDVGEKTDGDDIPAIKDLRLAGCGGEGQPGIQRRITEESRVFKVPRNRRDVKALLLRLIPKERRRYKTICPWNELNPHL